MTIGDWVLMTIGWIFVVGFIIAFVGEGTRDPNNTDEE